MSDYIKREDAINAIGIRWGKKESPAKDIKRTIYRNMTVIPSADVAPVVRCKDCKWFGNIGCAVEVVDETDMPKENDFCSFAERKDDETDRR